MTETGIVLKIDGSSFKADLAQIVGGVIEAGIKAYFAIKTAGLAGAVMPNAVTALFGALKNTKREETMEYRAWLLVSGGVLYAVEQVIAEIQIKELPSDGAIKSFSNGIASRVAARSYEIEPDFFSAPNRLPLLADVADELSRWLKPFGGTESALQTEERLKRYFPIGLHRTWMKDTIKFTQLEQALSSPFTPTLLSQREHDGYLQYLEEEFTQLRLIGQEEDDPRPVTLADVFVPLRAYFEKEDVDQATPHLSEARDLRGTSSEDAVRKRHVAWLFDELNKWIESANRRDAIRIISGGPGIGKSSSMRSFATRTARAGAAYPLLIPLQKLKPDRPLRERIDDYMINTKYIPFTKSPLNDENVSIHAPLLLIFDGLDELVKPGKDADDIARNFMADLRGLLEEENGPRGSTSARILAVVTGRIAAAGSAASALRISGNQVLHMMRFFEESKPQSAGEADGRRFEYVDPSKLLEEDQRQTWWALWRRAVPDVPHEIPGILLHEDLLDITVEPLLLYFVAFVQPWQTSAGENTLYRNALYERLLREFYKRECGKGGMNFASEFPTFEQYEPVLQAMALAAWYEGSTRTSTIDVVEKLLRDWDESILASFRKVVGSDKPAVGAALAFYMKPGERPNSFEFLHKTFAEYLVTRRIVDAIISISEAYQAFQADQAKRRKLFDQETILRDWLRLTGPRSIDFDLLRFLRDEVARCHGSKRELVIEWRAALVACMSATLRDGMPAHLLVQLRDDQLARRPQTFREASEQARNAEESLLAALNATILPDLSNDGYAAVEIRPNTQERTLLGAMIHRIRSQRVGARSIFLQLLAGLNMSGEIFYVQDFYGMDGTKANFASAEFTLANLMTAKLVGANFEKASLNGVNCEHADLRGANLVGTVMVDANCSYADFEYANIEFDVQRSGGSIVGSLKGANFRNVDLTRSGLTKEDLAGAKVEGALMSKKD